MKRARGPKQVSRPSKRGTSPQAQRRHRKGESPGLRVIGIGGSAGSIVPCAELLAAIPAPSPHAFIIAMHLSPTHESGLAALFTHATPMPVTEASEGEVLTAGHVYVIPAGSALVARKGALHLEARSSRRDPPSVIDRLFASLAESYGDQSVGVVLSGTGSDGTKGLEAIRARGGLTFVQEVGTAEHQGMPESAVQAGVVDHALPPAAIGLALGGAMAGVQRPEEASARAPATGGRKAATISAILAVLGRATGVDFAQYKRPTLERRIARRIEELQLTGPRQYLARLEADATEPQHLYREVLIQVTEFFRDPDALAALRHQALLPLLEGCRADEPLRIWVAGCASGEEAYSVAIEAFECASTFGRTPTVQVFATDLSEPALAMARAGVYPASIAAQISPERLARFFRAVDGGFEVQKRLRSACVFARHDLTRDPPFSRLDVVICRNVLIYLDTPLQQRALRTFHYALKPKGFLLLGPAETTTLARDLFVAHDRKHKLYAPSGARTEFPMMDLPVARLVPDGRQDEEAPPTRAPGRRTVPELERMAEQLYRLEYPTARIMVDDDLSILNLRGATAQYLEEPAGAPSTRLLTVVRPEFRAILGRLLHQVRTKRIRVRRDGIRCRDGARVRVVDLTVLPLDAMAEGSGRYLIVFAPGATSSTRASGQKPVGRSAGGSAARVRSLEQELRETRDYLESVIELQDAAQAEVQTAYEESLSINEEFQSTNEELETTKEELQSMNEEVTTLNEELQQRNAELSQTVTDLTNTFESTETPLVLVDRELRIRRYSPWAADLLGVRPGDLGHGLEEVRLRLAPADLRARCRAVIHEGRRDEVELEDERGHGYLFRIAPYRVVGDGIDGVVLTLVDVDAMHRLLRLSEVARHYSDVIIDTVRQPLVVLDERYLVRRANAAFYRTFRLDPRAAQGTPIFELMQGDWDFDRFHAFIEAADDTPHDTEVTHTFHDLGERILHLSTHRMQEPDRTEPSLLLAIDDVTERRRMEAYIQQAAKAEALGTMAGGLAHDLNNQLTVLMGSVEMIESAGVSESHVEDLAAVRHAAEHMAATTQQMLAFGRRQTLSPVPLELGTFLGSEEGLLRRVLGTGVRLVIEPGERPLWFTADPGRLEHALLNLAFNARDAMPAGGTLTIRAGVVTVDAAYLERYGTIGAIPGPHVRLTVTDTGVGMDEAIQARLFEPFFTTKDVGRGTGLGLASVYGFVTQSGGWIRVDSAPGKGSIFTLDFPMIESPATTAEAPPAGPVAGSDDDPATILVVDDEPMVLRTVARQLRRLGYQVQEAQHGAAALALVDRHPGPLDLLLTDVVMPGLSGPELHRRLIQRRPGTPVLFMSGHARQLLATGGSLTAAQTLLTKPFTRGELAAAVSAALAGRPPAGTLRLE